MMTGLQAQTTEQGKLLYDLGIFIQDTVAAPVDSVAVEAGADTLPLEEPDKAGQFDEPEPQRKTRAFPKQEEIPLRGGDMDLYQLVMDYQIRVARMELEIAKLYRSIDSLKTFIAEQGAGYRTDLAVLEKQNRLLGEKVLDLERMKDSAATTDLPENAMSPETVSADSIWQETAPISPQMVASLQSHPDRPNRSEEGIYRDALTKYHRQSYLTALDDFKRLTAYGKNKRLKASAQYYAGACYFAVGLMIPADQELIQVAQYEDSDKLDDALALRGIMYEKQGRLPEARSVFESLVRQYPNSEYVMVATRFLQRARKLSQHE
ncbi:MAG: tetratricopeptide repeat protein [Candidatus Marinimicrobia bacterium]|nr:tetratricopeptide repeat protein [Candidatus Neomarinimicrobiota bacterium]MCF7839847.1 tetratricopeptide repeat protein [Candidatus Neomarinimicrobiota bacterium]